MALQKAEELCSSNWNEISCLLDRVKLLESLLNENRINIPE
ncbi:MAG: mobility-associated LCxxNW protein [Clostridia bacterium]|nr:mobility-associated LCxxNW protein [Clostridia bacterium]